MIPAPLWSNVSRRFLLTWDESKVSSAPVYVTFQTVGEKNTWNKYEKLHPKKESYELPEQANRGDLQRQSRHHPASFICKSLLLEAEPRGPASRRSWGQAQQWDAGKMQGASLQMLSFPALVQGKDPFAQKGCRPLKVRMPPPASYGISRMKTLVTSDTQMYPNKDVPQLHA